MKRLVSKISAHKVASLGVLLASAFVMLSCRNANAGKDNVQPDCAFVRPDDVLTKITRALADGDASGFASLCSYPIPRPYPLRAIEDSVSMVDYFPILVDEQLRTKFKNSSLDDWENYGWRGWSIPGSNHLWCEEGVQLIDYLSPAEAALQRILAREEIMSLAPEFREGWTPVMTLMEVDGERVFRIDSKDDAFRLMGFDKAENLKGMPYLLLMGTGHTEGSADIRVFTFSNSEGMQAEFTPDAESQPRIFIKHPNLDMEESYQVQPAYWRDIIKY